MKKILSFTLAEVLITIGIIGAIAAITVPSLNQNAGDAESITRLKNTLGYLETAVSSAKEKYGEDLNLWVGTGSDDYKITTLANIIMNYLNVKRKCGIQSGNDCFSTKLNVQQLNGGDWGKLANKEKCYAFIMDNDASICVYSYGGLLIDIDGPQKGYNTIGRDLFVTYFDGTGTFYNYLDGVLNPEIMTNDLLVNCWKGANLDQASVCTEWILDFDNMDYLYTNGYKCKKTGVALSKDNPTCN